MPGFRSFFPNYFASSKSATSNIRVKLEMEKRGKANELPLALEKAVISVMFKRMK